MRYPIPFSVGLMLLSCAQDKSGEIDMLYQEVMAVHDEAMPRLGVIHELHMNIRLKLEQLDSLDLRSDSISQVLTNLNRRLDDADESMMEWMRNFEATYEGWQEDSVINYLTSELAKIRAVNETIDSGIKEARMVVSDPDDTGEND